MSTGPYVSPDYSRGLTRYLETTLPSYNVASASSINYHEVCGAEKASVAGDTSLLSQFTRQIGCPSNDYTSWKDNRLHYREQFDKARQCFSGRARRMAEFNADTPTNKESRKRHAYAAQAAYTIGRDCLRKFQDVPGALERYTESAGELIATLPTDVQTALKTDNTGTVWDSIDEAVQHHPELAPIYSNTYDMTEKQWNAYKRFLMFSAINARKYNQGEITLANIKQRYNRVMAGMNENSESNSEPSNNKGNVVHQAKTRRRRKGRRHTMNKRTTTEAENINRIVSNLSKLSLTAPATSGGGSAAATSGVTNTSGMVSSPLFVFPTLITLKLDDLAKDAAEKSYNVKTFMEWNKKNLTDTQITQIVSIIESGTPSARMVVMRVKLIPLLYYYTSASILFNYFEKLKDLIRDKYSRLTTFMLIQPNSMRKKELYKKAEQEYKLLDTLLTTYTDIELLSLCQTVFDTCDIVFGRISTIKSTNETITDYNSIMTYFNTSMKYYLQKSPFPLYNLRVSHIWPYLKDEPVNELIEEIAKIFN